MDCLENRRLLLFESKHVVDPLPKVSTSDLTPHFLNLDTSQGNSDWVTLFIIKFVDFKDPFDEFLDYSRFLTTIIFFVEERTIVVGTTDREVAFDLFQSPRSDFDHHELVQQFVPDVEAQVFCFLDEVIKFFLGVYLSDALFGCIQLRL